MACRHTNGGAYNGNVIRYIHAKVFIGAERAILKGLGKVTNYRVFYSRSCRP